MPPAPPSSLIRVQRQIPAGRWDSQTINLAIQAVDALLESSRATISNAINTATAPFVFTPIEKKRIVAFLVADWAEREGL